MEQSNLIEYINNVDFEITYLCNLHCLHCYNPTRSKVKELSTQDIKSITKEAYQWGFKEIHFNGGEPLIRGDIIEILENSCDLGLLTLLETNGTMLREIQIPFIKNLSIRSSIDGSEEMHNKIRKNSKIKNPFRTTLENLARLKRAGIPVQITSSINKLNYLTIYEMVRQINEYGIKEVRLRLTMPTGFAKRNWDILSLEREDLQRVIKISHKIVEDFKSVTFNYKSIIRKVPELEPKLFINPCGDVKPYPFIDYFIGNVKEEGLYQILDKMLNSSIPKEKEARVLKYLTELGMADKND